MSEYVLHFFIYNGNLNSTMLWLSDLRKMIVVAVVWWFFGIGNVFGSESTAVLEQPALSYTLWYAKFAKGTCTEYVASRRKDLFPSRHGNDRRFWGNAISWLSQAKKSKVPTGKKPQVWSIAVFGQWRGASSVYGHVAIVEKIIDRDTIVVSDMNYAWHGKVTKRTISSTLALGYIHKIPTTTDDKDHQVNTIISIQVPIWDIQESVTAGSISLWDDTLWHDLPTQTIIYAISANQWLPPTDTEDVIKEMAIIADNRYIMKHLTYQISRTTLMTPEYIDYQYTV